MRSESTISWSECGKGRGRNSMPSTIEKIAVVAPRPKASMSTAVAVKAGDCLNCRKTNRKSRKNERIRAPQQSLLLALDSTFLATADSDSLAQTEPDTAERPALVA